jgi:beta/gamma crystallin
VRPKRTVLAVLCAAATCAAAQAAEITIYKQPQFSGGGVTVKGATRDLGPLGVTDQASSLVVRGGRWEVCTQPDFNGDCRTLEPGKYATLDASLNHRIESVREVERHARGRSRDRYAWEGDRARDDRSAYEPPDNRRAYEPPDRAAWDGGNRDRSEADWTYGNRDRSEGGSAWRP